MTSPSSTKVHPIRIVCAALHNKRTNETIAGPRHHTKFMQQVLEMLPLAWKPKDIVEGFIDQHGKFYDREAAWEIADAQDQILYDRVWLTGSLHSEHLY